MVCPIGFLSWENGCLPYATANQKCPAGSEQCIQGLLCVDGKCLGACGEDELLVNGKCVYHGEPDCINTNCEEDGCPTNHPICTLQDNIYQCCKPKSSRRANRHIDKTTSEEIFEEQTTVQKRPSKRRKPRILPATIYNIAKPRKRILPSASTNIYIYKPVPKSTNIVRSINTANTVNTATISPFLATLTIPTPRTISLTSCVAYAEVQIGNQCYPRVAAGQGCTFTAQCPSTSTSAVSTSYRCINNVCQLNIVCSAGYFRFNNACLKYSATGQSCTATTTQCLSGSTCINGTCYSGCATNQLELEGVCVGYADYGCILRSCESDTCPTNFPVCNYLRSQNAYVCCTASLTNALVCANGERPQLSFGTNLPIDCIARSCARGYSCTHSIIDGTSRYICCPRTLVNKYITTTTAAPGNRKYTF
uniref:EB domain-containing protein n=1 Tax=Panagrolaimus davidi TaxID=227884 RepID=A0A914PY41_9BILA